MTSMLQNLIGNGLKYRGDGRADGAGRRAAEHDGRWEIAISDNGIGIEPRFHERVFGLFQRLHTAEEYPGTGMGLAIVKKIVESNGGSVRVESTPGEGATFFVTLHGGTRGMTAADEPHRLLVVEDSESDVELLREALADERAARSRWTSCATARTRSRSCAARARSGAPRAPTSSCWTSTCPRMGGFEVLRALREDVDPRAAPPARRRLHDLGHDDRRREAPTTCMRRAS